MNLKRLILVATFGPIFAGNAHATLIDRGNGMIYDSDQDITWLQDANYAMTSGYDADGLMHWDEATLWADSLVYGGFADWRLAAITLDAGSECSWQNGTCGMNVDPTSSEFAYLWYTILGNNAFDGLSSTSADGVTLLNLQPGWYWTGTEYTADTAWVFDMSNGFQGTWGKGPNPDFQGDLGSFAWAVRDGDVLALSGTIPEPGTLLLLAVGLLAGSVICDAGIAHRRTKQLLHRNSL